MCVCVLVTTLLFASFHASKSLHVVTLLAFYDTKNLLYIVSAAWMNSAVMSWWSQQTWENDEIIIIEIIRALGGRKHRGRSILLFEKGRQPQYVSSIPVVTIFYTFDFVVICVVFWINNNTCLPSNWHANYEILQLNVYSVLCYCVLCVFCLCSLVTQYSKTNILCILPY